MCSGFFTYNILIEALDYASYISGLSLLYYYIIHLLLKSDTWQCIVLSIYLIDGLLRAGRVSSALAMELRLSCANPSTCWLLYYVNLLPFIGHKLYRCPWYTWYIYINIFIYIYCLSQTCGTVFFQSFHCYYSLHISHWWLGAGGTCLQCISSGVRSFLC